jgi:hypothetical protein
MSDQSRKGHFSSGFTDLDEAGKTQIEKMLSHLSELPLSRQELPGNPEIPPICKPSDDKLQLGVEHEQ